MTAPTRLNDYREHSNGVVVNYRTEPRTRPPLKLITTRASSRELWVARIVLNVTLALIFVVTSAVITALAWGLYRLGSRLVRMWSGG
jgi:hypothetical protein